MSLPRKSWKKLFNFQNSSNNAEKLPLESHPPPSRWLFHAYLMKSKRPNFSLNLNHISGEAGNIPRQDFSPVFNFSHHTSPLRCRNAKNGYKNTTGHF